MKTETGKLYYTVFWVFLPSVMNNIELYHFKFGAFFESHCISLDIVICGTFTLVLFMN